MIKFLLITSIAAALSPRAGRRREHRTASGSSRHLDGSQVNIASAA
jgi:hypothetical protein